jgi:hypothetical protein
LTRTSIWWIDIVARNQSMRESTTGSNKSKERFWSCFRGNLFCWLKFHSQRVRDDDWGMLMCFLVSHGLTNGVQVRPWWEKGRRNWGLSCKGIYMTTQPPPGEARDGML